MIAYKYEYKDRQMPETITVIPAAAEHAEQVQMLAGTAYHVAPGEAVDWLGTNEYQSRLQRFPEGQYVALDGSGRVVGFTSSMRFQFDETRPYVETWEHTTGYG